MNWKLDVIRPWILLTMLWLLVTATVAFNYSNTSWKPVAFLVAVPLAFLALGGLGFWVAGGFNSSDPD